MEIPYTLIVLATIAQFILGTLWYSPLLFGKWWMEINDCTHLSKEEMRKMQKEMTPFYGLQFFLALFTTFSLATLVPYVPAFSIYHIAFWIWIGFIAPVQISSVIWGNTKKRYWVRQIFVMLSMQLAGLMLASWILGM